MTETPKINFQISRTTNEETTTSAPSFVVWLGWVGLGLAAWRAE